MTTKALAVLAHSGLGGLAVVGGSAVVLDGESAVGAVELTGPVPSGPPTTDVPGPVVDVIQQGRRRGVPEDPTRR